MSQPPSPSLFADALMGRGSRSATPSPRVSPRGAPTLQLPGNTGRAGLYEKKLRHMFTPAHDQAANGLYVLKRAAFFLKKVAALSQRHGEELAQVCEHEREKENKLCRDELFPFPQAFLMSQDVSVTMARKAREHGQAVQKLVVTPLENQYNELAAKLKSAHTRWRKLHDKATETRKKVAHERENCKKLWEALTKAHSEHQRAVSEKTHKKLVKSQDKTKAAFKKFEALRAEALESLRLFHNEQLPGLLREVEAIELKRTQTLKSHLQLYSRLHEDLVAPEQISNAFMRVATTLDCEKEIDDCVSNWVVANGEAPTPVPLRVGLPCVSLALEGSAWIDTPEDWETRYPQTQPVVDDDLAATAAPSSSSSSSAFQLNKKGGDDGHEHKEQKKTKQPTITDKTLFWARATADFTMVEDVKFQVGDTLRVTKTEGIEPEGWFEAEVWRGVEDRLAVAFPPKMVERISDTETTSALDKQFRASVTAATLDLAMIAMCDYEFQAADDDEENFAAECLSFKKGDVIKVVSREDASWWVGELDGHTGFFPTDLCQAVGGEAAETGIEQSRPRRGGMHEQRQGGRWTARVEHTDVGDEGDNDGDGEEDDDTDDDDGDDEEKKKSSLANSLANVIRGKVSKKKRRFKQDGYDLDLSYVDADIIAMGFPSEGLEAQYRNPLPQVQRFFKEFHDGRFKIFNLCSERFYDPELFNGCVSRYPFDDHNPCPMDMVDPFCESAKRYLGEHPDNVVAIHCKAGKGRTGFLIACLLLKLGRARTAPEALRFFAVKRTYDGKGVTIPSQIRYVNYYARALANDPPVPSSRPLRLTSLLINNIRLGEKADVWFTVDHPHLGTPQFTSKGRLTPVVTAADEYNACDSIRIDVPADVMSDAVDGDFKVQVYHQQHVFGGKTKLFQFWFNTRFISGGEDNKYVLRLTKPQLDKACKDKKHAVFGSELNVVVELAKSSNT